MQIHLSSGNYHIIDSNQVFLFGPDAELKINIVADNNFELTVVLKFRKNPCSEQKIDTNVNENIITLTCLNFDDLGTGLAKPFRIAQIDGQEISLLFWSYLEGAGTEKVRSVKYTLFMSNKVGENLDGK